MDIQSKEPADKIIEMAAKIVEKHYHAMMREGGDMLKGKMSLTNFLFLNFSLIVHAMMTGSPSKEEIMQVSHMMIQHIHKMQDRLVLGSELNT